jgi:Polyketide cyclase / dehydrase and lipid transport
MAQALATLDIPATSDAVWKVIGGFGSLPDWVTFVSSVELSEGGRIRKFDIPDGPVVERLESFSNVARSYSYSIVSAPAPVTDYLSTIKVSAGKSEKHCVVEWSGTFVPAGVSEAEASAIFQDPYEGGLASLKEAITA